MNRTCQGQCCAVFQVKFPRGIRSLMQDEEQIRDMVIKLTPAEAAARAEKFGIDINYWTRDNAYTCRHWDEETGLCGIYEDRPAMCRDYPYGNDCSLCPGCTFKAPEDSLTDD